MAIKQKTPTEPIQVPEKPIERSLTINDFKMWISGIEEMQEDSWSPSPSQWRRIREKIDLIIVEVKHVESQPQSSNPYERAYVAPISTPASAFERAPVLSVGVPSGVPMATGDGQTIKTPSSNTTGYKTQFA